MLARTYRPAGKYRQSRAVPTPARHATTVEAALDQDLVELLAWAGGSATLRELFDRDRTWELPAPLWAMDAAARIVRGEWATLHRSKSEAWVYTLTPAGLSLAGLLREINR